MAALPVLPPEAVILIDMLGRGRPPGTAEKPFYDWLLAVQRAVASGGAHLPGVVDGSDPAAGEVGEIIESNIAFGVAVACTSGVARDVTSIALTPGDWRVSFNGKFVPGSGTVVTGGEFGISTVSATIQNTNESRLSFLAIPDAGFTGGGAFAVWSLMAGPSRISVTVPTTIYAVVNGIFTVNTLSAYGHLRAERRR